MTLKNKNGERELARCVLVAPCPRVEVPLGLDPSRMPNGHFPPTVGTRTALHGGNSSFSLELALLCLQKQHTTAASE